MTSIIKKFTSLLLSLLMLAPLFTFAAYAEMGKSQWGYFAEDYMKRYREEQERKNNQKDEKPNNNDFGLPAPPPPKGTYSRAICDDVESNGVNYFRGLFADLVKEEAEKKLNKGNVAQLKEYENDLEKALGMNQHGHSKFSKRKGAIHRAQTGIDTSRAKINKIKNGVETGMNVLSCGYGLYKMYDEPDVGYDSPFFEFCANSMRGMSAVSNVILPQYSKYYGYAESVTTSKVLVKFVNDRKWKRGPLDEFVDTFNKYYQGLFEKWFNKDQLKQVEENEKLLSDMQKKCQGASFTSNRVNVYKPNIYLYPEKECEVSVVFTLPELLTVTDPVYGNGWRVGAKPNGTLSLGESEYGYLFYESLTDPDIWQTEEGFFIPAEGREEAFERILSSYGLNGREIADFVEFWCEKLDEGCTYSMYPQLTEAVDGAMPVNVSPAPNSVLRIWFAFVKDSEPLREADIQSFDRDGFTLIEWGGFFLD
ncbi:MAG: hypothetical protein IJT70_00445 [Clostridia bacterium]|nr:hypothetical protein [Clostridia bacterium]